MAETSNIKVCVRVRPFHRKERERKCIVTMYQNATFLTHPQTWDWPPERQKRMVFTFDHSFWSVAPEDSSDSTATDQKAVVDQQAPAVVDQKAVYDHIGADVLKNVLEGYNGCIMAYGQSGSGKTHTMLGGTTAETRGLIPRLAEELFDRLHLLSTQFQFRVDLSYLEIYAERIHDLIQPTSAPLRVREHPLTGPYVENLTSVPVENYYAVSQFLLYGHQQRATAATQLNDRSSRSHAILVLQVTQVDPSTDEPLMRSKLCLVDLAGSERVKDSGVTGIHFQEATNINTSLTTLGRVINILAKAKEGTAPFVPFRDSLLTWLLKDTLGGNSKTVMIATISPSSVHYEETLGTLKYAYRAKQIVNKISINAGANAALLAKLRLEITALEERWRAIRHTQMPDVKTVPLDDTALKAVTSSWQQFVDRSLSHQSQTLSTYAQHWDTVQSDLQWPFLFDCGPAAVDRELIRYVPRGRTAGHLIHPALASCDVVHDHEGVWLVLAAPTDPAVLLSPLSSRTDHPASQTDHPASRTDHPASQTDHPPFLSPLSSSSRPSSASVFSSDSVPLGHPIFVNGQPLDEPRLLDHGDRITAQDSVTGLPLCLFKFKVPICAIKEE